MGLFFHILCVAIHTWLRILCGVPKRHLVAEVIAMRAQLIITKRKTHPAPPLSPALRLVFGFLCAFVPARMLSPTFVIVKPSTVLKFHRWLIAQKYSRLYRNRQRRSGRPPIPKEVRALIIEIKERNPTFGCPQTAAVIFDRTGVAVSEESARRTLLKSYGGNPGGGPSWLSFLGTQANSLWSLDLFQVESMRLKTHWALVVMDQWSRKIVGFAVSPTPVTGIGLAAMFSSSMGSSNPKRLSHDHDPLFRSLDWKRVMAVLEIEEIWSVPFVPISHPFVERLIGPIRRELLDRTLFWNERDLLRKLEAYKTYFNSARVHSAIEGRTPDGRQSQTRTVIEPANLVWKSFCQGLFNVPIAA